MTKVTCDRCKKDCTRESTAISIPGYSNIGDLCTPCYALWMDWLLKVARKFFEGAKLK